MTKELVISANRHETKVAVLEDDQLVEIYYQRSQEYSLAGSIHKGRVTRVLPGMQSAFVDLGLERDTFLYVSDFFEESDEYEKLPDDRGRGRGREERGGRAEERTLPPPAQALPASTPAVEAAPSEEAVAAPPAVAAAPAELRAPRQGDGRHPRGERRGRDDRGPDRGGDRGGDRNRRGRRRRGRGGRGFPESKYAEARPADDQPTQPLTDEPIEVTAADSGLELLPGETLRKYRRPVDGTEPDDAEQDTAEDAAPPTAGDEAATVLPPESDAEADSDFDTEEDTTGEADDEIAETTVPTASSEEPEVEEVAAATEIAQDNPADILNERSSGLTDVQLDHIQEQAEELAMRGEIGTIAVPEPEPQAEVGDDSEADSEEEPDLYADTGIEAADAADVEGDEMADETGEEIGEDVGDEGSDEPDAILAEAAGELSTEPQGDGEPGIEPPLASMDSIGSSHREQTSRYMRGRRMRRRRGGQGDVRTVSREGAEGAEARETREPREARETREPREGRGDGRGREAREPREGRESRGDGRSRESRESRERERPPSITELLKEGQEIVVQIAKEPMGQKGARITSHIALPGRYCVYMPTVEHLGVSRKISTDDERQRLRKILQKHREGIPGGFIIRTAGEGKTEEQIAADIQYLSTLWQEIKAKADKSRSPALLYHDVEVVQRLLRDQLTDNFKAIWVDNEELYEGVVRFVGRMQPQMVSRVKLYTRTIPIFDSFNITAELEKALRPKVWLKTGGYIVINQTEALVAIDVNTGKFVGKSNRLEDTIVKTNTDAVKEIVRQIRLRDLGGIIVVDFIDMDERKNRQKVMIALEESMRADRAPNKILQFNDFGLVAITRKRVKQSLERTLCSPCPTCEGSGYTKSVQTVIGEILIEAQKLANVVEGKDVMLRVNPSVAVSLKSRDNSFLEEIEEIFRKPVIVRSDDTMHPEKFDLA
ncbi:MAG: Rne/Rng family ribonuclease [Acidobacteria bacterium]|nr:Rne/Rng family ribonuclease [Acidobacteriota bacterium]